jgi:hypothetical protein
VQNQIGQQFGPYRKFSVAHSLNSAIDKLNSEKGRRQNGVRNADGLKNSQGGFSWKIR